MNRQRRDLNLPLYHSINDMHANARVLVNTAFGLEYLHPSNPLYTYTGPLLLPQEMKGDGLSDKTENQNLLLGNRYYLG